MTATPQHFSDDDRQILAERPWLAAFVEPGDDTIDAALARFDAAEREARQHLRANGIAAHRRARTATGLETTAVALHPQDKKS